MCDDIVKVLAVLCVFWSRELVLPTGEKFEIHLGWLRECMCCCRWLDLQAQERLMSLSRSYPTYTITFPSKER